MRAPAILIVDDEQEMCSSLEEIIRDEGFLTRWTTDPASVLALLSQERFDLMLLDIRMPGIGGIDLLGRVKDLYPELPVIMITGGLWTLLVSVAALRSGAFGRSAQAGGRRKPTDARPVRTDTLSRRAPRS